MPVDPLPAQLVNPASTADQKVEQWKHDRAAAQAAGVNLQNRRLPALDLAAMRRKYGPRLGDRPQYRSGTFKVPLGIAHNIVGRERPPDDIRERYEKIRNGAVAVFIDSMEKMDYRCVAGRHRWRIRVQPANYPWPDLMLGGAGNPEYREFEMLLPFIKKGRVETLRMELPGHLFEDSEVGDGVRAPDPDEQ